MLDHSQKILKFRSLKPLNSTRENFFNIKSDNTFEDFSIDELHQREVTKSKILNTQSGLSVMFKERRRTLNALVNPSDLEIERQT